MGETLEERSAGMSPAATVTRMPTAGPVMSAAGEKDICANSGIQNARAAAASPQPRSRPSPMPNADPTMPSVRLSSTAAPRTWDREAPTARKRASTRVREATSTLKVFEMTRAATPAARRPKAMPTVEQHVGGVGHGFELLLDDLIDGLDLDRVAGSGAVDGGGDRLGELFAVGSAVGDDADGVGGELGRWAVSPASVGRRASAPRRWRIPRAMPVTVKLGPSSPLRPEPSKSLRLKLIAEPPRLRESSHRPRPA